MSEITDELNAMAQRIQQDAEEFDQRGRSAAFVGGMLRAADMLADRAVELANAGTTETKEAQQ